MNLTLADREIVIMVKKVYKKEEGEATDCFDFIELADSIHESLGDKEWAKKVYKKAEDKVEGLKSFSSENISDFRLLAESIHKNLGDEEWARKLYYAAFYKTVSQQVPVGGGELFDLAESIRNNLGDKELAKEVDEQALYR